MLQCLIQFSGSNQLNYLKDTNTGIRNDMISLVQAYYIFVIGLVSLVVAGCAFVLEKMCGRVMKHDNF